LGPKNTNAPLILKVLEIIFLSGAKHMMGHFLGFFEFFYAQDNLGVKKVSAPSKNPKKCPIICFAHEKKLISRTFKISGALIVKNYSADISLKKDQPTDTTFFPP
jgi:hypothetical protein